MAQRVQWDHQVLKECPENEDDEEKLENPEYVLKTAPLEWRSLTLLFKS